MSDETTPEATETAAPEVTYHPDGRLTDAGYAAVVAQLSAMDGDEVEEQAEATEPEAEATPADAQETRTANVQSKPSETPSYVERARAEKQAREQNARIEEQLKAREAAIRAEYEQRIKNDLEGVLADVGIVPDQYNDVATKLWMKQLGDDAPPALKEKLRQAELERKYQELSTIEQRIEQKLMLAEAQRKADVYGTELRTLASSSSEYPELAFQMEDDPKGTYEAIEYAAVQLAKEHGQPLPPADVLAWLEQTTTEFYRRREEKLGNRKPQASKSAQSTKRQPTTLTNKAVTGSSPKSGELDLDELRRRAAAALDG